MPKNQVVRNNFTALGVFSLNEKVYLFYSLRQKRNTFFQIDTSLDGFNFKKLAVSPEIIDRGRKISTEKLQDFRISKVKAGYFLTYKKKEAGKYYLYGCLSDNLISWKKVNKLLPIQETAVVVSDYFYQNKYVMYYGDSSIAVAYSKDLKTWQKEKGFLLDPEKNFFGSSPLKIASVLVIDEGILLFYFVHTGGKSYDRYYLKSALFDKNNPARLIQKTKVPLWESTEQWEKKRVIPLGIVELAEKLVSYWRFEKGGIFAVTHPFFERRLFEKKKRKSSPLFLKKFKENPIIKPIAHHFWESKATFNPAAVYEDGKVHIVYRAIGDSDVSVLGYATSRDGVNIDSRHKEPIYVPSEPFETGVSHPQKPTLSPYASGGGCYGGCEDPRITKVGDKFYMTYVAYDGKNPPRVALTSIWSDDFLNHRWNWEKPVLISPPGVVDKNACIFPEKINGKYVIYHRIYPNILIDYVDSLDFDGLTFLKGEYIIHPKKTSWDSRKIGAGPPPLKTEHGWLLIYHAIGEQDPGKYKIGAMLLDLNDPTRVLYRTTAPILEPSDWYENEGHKSGVAYPCGAVIKEKKLLVYYGGADTVVCVAFADINNFLTQLITSETAQLTPLNAQMISQ